MKDIRCFFGRHRYACGDMVLRYISEDSRKVQFAVKFRCVRCGKVRQDSFEISKPQEGRSI